MDPELHKKSMMSATLHLIRLKHFLRSTFNRTDAPIRNKSKTSLYSSTLLLTTTFISLNSQAMLREFPIGHTGYVCTPFIDTSTAFGWAQIRSTKVDLQVPLNGTDVRSVGFRDLPNGIFKSLRKALMGGPFEVDRGESSVLLINGPKAGSNHPPIYRNFVEWPMSPTSGVNQFRVMTAANDNISRFYESYETVRPLNSTTRQFSGFQLTLPEISPSFHAIAEMVAKLTLYKNVGIVTTGNAMHLALCVYRDIGRHPGDIITEADRYFVEFNKLSEYLDTGKWTPHQNEGRRWGGSNIAALTPEHLTRLLDALPTFSHRIATSSNIISTAQTVATAGLLATLSRILLSRLNPAMALAPPNTMQTIEQHINGRPLEIPDHPVYTEDYLRAFARKEIAIQKQILENDPDFASFLFNVFTADQQRLIRGRPQS